VVRGIVALLVGVVVVLVAGAGCGGGDDDSLSTAEFVKQADAICTNREAEKNKNLEAAFQKANQEGAKGKEVEEKLVTETALPPIREMTEELSDLGAPSGEEDQVESMIAAFEAEIEKIEGDPASALTGSGGSFEKADQLAQGLGLKACSQV
jgi:uncharacterized membrane protein YdbT with pleckstrin-like domain